MTSAVDRVLTQNVWGQAPAAIAEAVLRRVLAREPDIVALQEWSARRTRLLRRNGRLLRLPGLRRVVRRSPWRPATGFVWARPLRWRADPIGLRGDRYELLGCRAVTLTGRRRVTPTERQTRAVQPPTRVTVVVARDHARAEEVAVLGFHLWAGAQARGRYSERPADRARVAGHRDQVAALGRLVEAQLDLGRVVYALGDSNFDGMRLPGVVSSWDGREDEPRGTFGVAGRKIDDVFGPGPATSLELVEHPEPSIDHRGVLAIRRRH